MFYERFVLLCKQRGVSTSKAAIDAGLSKSTVTKWKKDPNTKPSGNVIDKLCRYFGISVSELLGASDAAQPEEDVRPVTQQDIKFALFGGSGDITVWINSPGGDCVAAAQIYNMLMDYKGNVTVKIDGIAASAASVIAMAGTKVLVSPVSMLMIHNPMTAAFGNSDEMQRAIEMLGSVKDSIINAYEIKTGLSRAKLSHLMDAETWMDANKAVELGFADEIMKRSVETENVAAPTVSMLYSKANVVNSLMEKIAAKCAIQPKDEAKHRADDLMARLDLIKNWR